MPLIREANSFRLYSDGPDFGQWVDHIEDADWFTEDQAYLIVRARGYTVNADGGREHSAKIIPDDEAIEMITARKCALLADARALDAMHRIIIDHRNCVNPESNEARVRRAFDAWASDDDQDKIFAQMDDQEIAKRIRPFMVEVTNSWIAKAIASMRSDHEKGKTT